MNMPKSALAVIQPVIKTEFEIVVTRGHDNLSAAFYLSILCHCRYLIAALRN
jgi:hypothetical protein